MSLRETQDFESQDTSETVLSRVAYFTERSPERPILTWVDKRGRAKESYTYRRFDLATRRLVPYLLDHGLTRGQHVVLAYTPGPDFYLAFWTCLRCGLVPVPVSPPLSPSDIPSFLRIYRDCEAAAVLTDTPYARLLALKTAQSRVAQLGQRVASTVRQTKTATSGPQFSSLQALPWITTSGRGRPHHDTPDTPQPRDAPAFVMYSSGSTSAPKGALTTFANMHHQFEMIATRLDARDQPVNCWWAPHFHDFGLLSGFLNTAHQGGHAVVASPLDFIQRPTLWLDMLHRFGATHTFGPDFAYQLLIKRTTAAQRASGRWSLHALRVAMSAAEKVRAETLDAFSEAFAAAGFRPETFCPAYGLAEHTVGVTISGVGQPVHVLDVAREPLEVAGEICPVDPSTSPRSVRLVGCGTPGDGVTVKIVALDDDGVPVRVLGDDRVGEVWVSSPSKTAGYHRLPDLSQEVFQAKLPGQPAPGMRFLRTGDYGFTSSRHGDLFLCGRRKDMVILAGKNHYSEDLEATAAAAASDHVRPGRVAAFALDDEASGTEQLALVAEVRDPQTCDRAATFHALRHGILHEQKVEVAHIALIAPGAIPKTTSGKLRRFQVREQLLRQSLKCIADGTWTRPPTERSLPPPRSASHHLVHITQSMVGPSHIVRLQDAITHHLPDEAAVARLLACLNAWHIEPSLNAEVLAAAETLAALGAHLDQQVASAESGASLPLTQAISQSPATLQPGAYATVAYPQQSILISHFLEGQRSSQWNIPLAMWLHGPLCPERLRLALEDVAARHPQLRSTFHPLPSGGFCQRLEPTLPEDFFQVTAVHDRSEAIARGTSDARSPMDITRGVFRASIYPVSPEESAFTMVVHHAAFDGASVDILFRDLRESYRRLEEGTPQPEHEAAIQFVDFAYWQRRRHLHRQLTANLDYWAEHLRAPLPMLALPSEYTGWQTPPRPAPYTVHVSEDIITPCRRLARKLATSTIHMLLMTVYAEIVAFVADQRDLVVRFPTAGRPPEAADVVGCFAEATVVRLPVGHGGTLAESLQRCHAVMLEALKHPAPLYLISERLDPSAAGLQSLNQVVLNWDQTSIHQGRDTDFSSTVHADLFILDTLAEQRVDPVQSMLNMHFTASGALHGRWMLNTERLSEQTARAMATAMGTLLSEGLRTAGQVVIRSHLADMIPSTRTWAPRVAVHQSHDLLGGSS